MEDKILRKVAEMRHYQKEYFRTRSKDVLTKSKALEKEVDKLLEDYFFANPTLF